MLTTSPSVGRATVRSIGLLGLSYGILPVGGALTVQIDLDLDAPEIQAVREVEAGESFEASVVVDIGEEGISTYSLSLQLDVTALELVAVEEIAPAAMSSLIPGTVATLDANQSTLSIASFDAFTFTLGPASSRFEVGRLTLRALDPEETVVAEISPGFFAAVDGAFDNTSPLGQDLEPGAILQSGEVTVRVPEDPDPPTPVPLPELEVVTQNKGLSVSWEHASEPEAFVLQESSTLQSGSWTDTERPVDVQDGQFSVAIDAAVETRFFRLRRGAE